MLIYGDLSDDFKLFIEKILNENKNIRICDFYYLGRKYWLKQLETTVDGGFLTKFFKINPKKSLKNEINALGFLNSKNASTPKLIAYGDTFLIISDVGAAVNEIIEKERNDLQKINILKKCSEALANLHEINLIHGRPAIRDMAWDGKKISFLDFEAMKLKQDLQKQKVLDLLIFVYELFRCPDVKDAWIDEILENYYDVDTYNLMRLKIKKYKFLLQLLYPFKNSSKKDLSALIRILKWGSNPQTSPKARL
jgi:30S ribosomal protein S15